VPAKGRDTMGVIFAKPDKNDRIIEVARNSERGLEGEEAEATDPENPAESPAAAGDDVTLAEGAGPDSGSAEADSAPAVESDESSDNAELDEENTGGNE